MDTVSFDIFVLGLREGTTEGRRGLVRTVAGLGELEHREAERRLRETQRPVFEALSREAALKVVNGLELAGATVEIRPVVGRPPAVERLGATQTCPECGFEQPAERNDCASCGVVFAKREREQVRQMRRSRVAEEAAIKAAQVRAEWAKRAAAFLQRNPLPADAAAPFAQVLRPAETPFLRLDSEEGPLLLTTLRLLALREGAVLSCPYELMADIDMGGGLVVRKDQMRMVLRFHGELVVDGRPVRQAAWRMTRESAQYDSVLMDWVYARSFTCDACGEGELQYRLQNGKVHGRCTRCAADHMIDCEDALLIPLPP